jgi:hypothetical protein
MPALEYVGDRVDDKIEEILEEAGRVRQTS